MSLDPIFIVARLNSIEFYSEMVENVTDPYYRTSRKDITLSIDALDFFLRGPLKSVIYKTQPASLEDLWLNIIK